MRQLVQSVRSGDLTIVEAPDPLIGSTEVLVQTSHSVVSTGTERAVRDLASASLLQKAKGLLRLVRHVFGEAREDGIRAITSVMARLEDDISLGYSGSGVVLEVGEAVASVRCDTHGLDAGLALGDLLDESVRRVCSTRSGRCPRGGLEQ